MDTCFELPISLSLRTVIADQWTLTWLSMPTSALVYELQYCISFSSKVCNDISAQKWSSGRHENWPRITFKCVTSWKFIILDEVQCGNQSKDQRSSRQFFNFIRQVKLFATTLHRVKPCKRLQTKIEAVQWVFAFWVTFLSLLTCRLYICDESWNWWCC